MTRDITILLLLRPHTLNKYVHNTDISTTLYVVILESYYILFLSLSSAAHETLQCPNKDCKQHSQGPDWMFHFPILPIVLCSAPFHWCWTVTLETGAPYVPPQALSTVYLASPVISNYPPLTDCSVSLAVCRLDMMILRLQCKRIVTQFCLACKVHITTQSDWYNIAAPKTR